MHRNQFIDELEEDDASYYNEGGEPPPNELQKRPSSHNNIIGPQTNAVMHKRFKCYSCEPPDCALEVECNNALQVNINI